MCDKGRIVKGRHFEDKKHFHRPMRGGWEGGGSNALERKLKRKEKKEKKCRRKGWKGWRGERNRVEIEKQIKKQEIRKDLLG